MAQRDRPGRVLFPNQLPTGTAGNFLPQLPFRVPNSMRPLNAVMPLGSTNVDPKTGQPVAGGPYTNIMYNFGSEYVWHCHLLGHEENDMMRPLVVRPAPPTGTLSESLAVDAMLKM